MKTAVARPLKTGHSAQFNLSLSQLRTPITPDVTYVFAVRHHNCWDAFVVIDRAVLDEENSLHNVGSENGDRFVLRLRFTKTGVFCGQRDLSNYKNNWEHFPVIEH